MSSNNNDDNSTESIREGPQTFNRNRYFTGKLMTASDMRKEQEYHSNRLNTISQFVTGRGIVCGLRIKELSEEADGLRATVEPGLAIDNSGRQIVVVDREQSKPVKPSSLPDGNKVFLHLKYVERNQDLVPVPGLESARNENEEHNETQETFEIGYEEDPDSNWYKEQLIREVDLPKRKDEFNHIAYKYHEDKGCETSSDPAVFLGVFEKRGNSWELVEEETKRRPFVYTNDMLYAAAVRSAISLNDLHEDVTDHERHLVTNSLRSMYWAYFNLGEKLEGTGGGGIATDLRDNVKIRLDAEDIQSPNDYDTFIRDNISQQRDVASEVQSDANSTADLFKKAVADLAELQELPTAPSNWEMIRAQDWVNQTGQRVKKPT